MSGLRKRRTWFPMRFSRSLWKFRKGSRQWSVVSKLRDLAQAVERGELAEVLGGRRSGSRTADDSAVYSYRAALGSRGFRLELGTEHEPPLGSAKRGPSAQNGR